MFRKACAGCYYMSDTNKQGCPYIGLRAFEREETHLFFGRETQTDTLIDKLQVHHFLGVIGASGCGKSSLVKAGLISGLESCYMRQAGDNWIIADSRPSDHPYQCLAIALLEDLQFASAWQKFSGEDEPQRLQSLLQASLQRGSRSLRVLLDELQQGEFLSKDAQLLILVDQFEEIFLFCQKNENEAAAFIALLLETLKQANCYIVITMQSDYLGDAAEFAGLPEIINQSLFLTPRLNREQLTDAISLPAQMYGGKVELDLISQLINEANNEHDQLPMLQHVLAHLWKQSGNHVLTLVEYQKHNSLRNSINSTAELAYRELNKEQQNIAEKVFKFLVSFDNKKQNRHFPVDIEEVAKLTGTPIEEIVIIVDVFCKMDRNFVTITHSSLRTNTAIEISHECLIRHWDRLQQWLQQKTETKRINNHLKTPMGKKEKIKHRQITKCPHDQLEMRKRLLEGATPDNLLLSYFDLSWIDENLNQKLIYLEKGNDQLKILGNEGKVSDESLYEMVRDRAKIIQNELNSTVH